MCSSSREYVSRNGEVLSRTNSLTTITNGSIYSSPHYFNINVLNSYGLATLRFGPVSRFSTKKNEKLCQLSCWQRRYPLKQFFKIIRRHIVAVAVNPNGIVKGFNILKYKPIGMFVVNNMKSVKPFSFD